MASPPFHFFLSYSIFHKLASPEGGYAEKRKLANLKVKSCKNPAKIEKCKPYMQD
jgi:hypothetical protein